ncbi:hypothetical protein D3C85_1098810 [compost metagenome]
MSQQTFPWRERDDYSISAWLSDLTNIVKQRHFLIKKADSWLVVMENMNEVLECYVDGMSPIECYNEMEGVED